MKIISSYGVELRKQEYSDPLEHWRFTILLSAIWSKCMNLCGKNWPQIGESKKRFNAKWNIWCIQRKQGIRPSLI